MFSFVSALSIYETERSYRMCYLNHTNQTLHNFYYYSVLVASVLILLNYLISMNRTAVAVTIAHSFTGSVRQRLKKKKKRQQHQRSGNEYYGSNFFSSTAFLMFRHVPYHLSSQCMFNAVFQYDIWCSDSLLSI